MSAHRGDCATELDHALRCTCERERDWEAAEDRARDRAERKAERQQAQAEAAGLEMEYPDAMD